MTIKRFKEILGDEAKKMTETEILNLMSALDYLSDYWLDQQEIKIFGKTIKELLDQ